MTDVKDQMLTEEDFIEHFGVKGMKWGRRKSETMNPAHVSADDARYNKIKSRVEKKGLDNLSNDDLAKLNKRNQLLSEYKKQNPGKFKKGAEATKEAVKNLKTAGVIIGGLAAVGVAGVGVARGIKALKESGDPVTAKAGMKVAASGAKAVYKVIEGLKV
jgi:hypothetical protein